MSEPNSLQARVARITARLEEIHKAEKSEDFINLKQGNDPEGERLKNVGGQGLNSLPKAGKAVGKDEGSGGDVKKGKGLGKGEMACTACNGGKIVKKGELCKMCGGAGRVKMEAQQTGGQRDTPLVVTAGLKVPGGGKSPAYQHQGPAAHSSDRPPMHKDEVPAAKPPSGKMPGAAPKPTMSGAPKVGGAPGGAPAGGMPKPAAMAKPVMGKGEMAPGGPPARTGTLLPKTKVVAGGGQAMSGNVQRMYRQAQQQQMMTRFNALRSKAIREAGVQKSELVAGAAHHLNGLNAAIARQDDAVAQQHARLCVVYERLLGYEPAGAVPAEIETAAGTLAKGERPTIFKAFARDRIVEDLFKNLLGLLPKTAALAANAPALALPGVKGGAKGGNLRTSGAAGGAPHLPGLKAPQSVAFGSPNGVPAPKIDIKLPTPDPTGANPMQPKPAGSALARIRQSVFGSKTAAAAPPSAGSDGAGAKKAPAGK